MPDFLVFFRILVITCLIQSSLFASEASDYVTEFQTYLIWKKNLPDTPNSKFLAFLNTQTPLAERMRKQWLEQLAKNKRWSIFLQYYTKSESKTLQCLRIIFVFQGLRQCVGYTALG